MSNQTNTAYYNKLNTDISTYFVITSSAIGISLNLVNIIVFARTMHQKINMGLLCTCQATVDLVLLLITLLLARSSPFIFPQSLDSVSDPMCKFIKYIRRLPLHLSSWMNVIITFDRFVFILYGNGQKFKFMKKKSSLATIIVGIFLFLAIIDFPNLLYYLPPRSVNPDGTLGPAATCIADFPALISSDMISIFFRTYIPLSLMLFFNVLMIRKIFRNSRSSFKQTSLSRKEANFTIAVMAFDVYFFVLNFPLSVFYILYDVHYYSGVLSTNSEFGALYNLVLNVMVNFSFCVQTFSFFMNLAFNKVFRQTLLQLIGALFGIAGLRRIHPSSDKNNSNSTQTQTQTKTQVKTRTNAQNTVS
jgi:hypothetical protein